MIYKLWLIIQNYFRGLSPRLFGLRLLLLCFYAVWLLSTCYLLAVLLVRLSVTQMILRISLLL
nr:MAG TPA: hypothetical protein [Microviridae sp.]